METSNFLRRMIQRLGGADIQPTQSSSPKTPVGSRSLGVRVRILKAPDLGPNGNALLQELQSNLEQQLSQQLNQNQ